MASGASLSPFPSRTSNIIITSEITKAWKTGSSSRVTKSVGCVEVAEIGALQASKGTAHIRVILHAKPSRQFTLTQIDTIQEMQSHRLSDWLVILLLNTVGWRLRWARANLNFRYLLRNTVNATTTFA